jgi:hypothetical protein
MMGLSSSAGGNRRLCYELVFYEGSFIPFGLFIQHTWLSGSPSVLRDVGVALT